MWPMVIVMGYVLLTKNYPLALFGLFNFIDLFYFVLHLQGMRPLDATTTNQFERSSPWKERMLFWMDRMVVERIPLQSALWLPWKLVTACLQFRLVGGVQQVLQQQRPLTSMESLRLVSKTVKADHGQIKFTWLIADQLLVDDYSITKACKPRISLK